MHAFVGFWENSDSYSGPETKERLNKELVRPMRGLTLVYPLGLCKCHSRVAVLSLHLPQRAFMKCPLICLVSLLLNGISFYTFSHYRITWLPGVWHGKICWQRVSWLYSGAYFYYLVSTVQPASSSLQNGHSFLRVSLSLLKWWQCARPYLAILSVCFPTFVTLTFNLPRKIEEGLDT